MDVIERARKNEQTILKHLSEAKQARVAEVVGVHESTISKMKGNGDFEKIGRLLSACGLKVVPVEFECHSPEWISALRELARVGIENKEAGLINWDDQ